VTRRPLILVTNDDGIESPGLQAAVGALRPLGELLIVAPMAQSSGAGRSFPRSSRGRIHRVQIPREGEELEAFAVDGTPAQVVQHALLELASRPPDLAVVGINYGENLGNGVMGSGTVGAAMEAASSGVPSLALSLQTATEYHHSHSTEISFGSAAHFCRFFARRLLAVDSRLPHDVDLLKIDVPDDATPHTPWRVTSVSRQDYYHTLPPERKCLADEGPLGYHTRVDWAVIEPESDIYALIRDRVVAVAPISLDLSSRVERDVLKRLLSGDSEGDAW
jgi:5'-nucleotidase